VGAPASGVQHPIVHANGIDPPEVAVERSSGTSRATALSWRVMSLQLSPLVNGQAKTFARTPQ
jgi:hypothetical protein